MRLPLINREKSILAFQERVLHQAKVKDTPLLERILFLTIVSSNLDEFFEVRFANIKERIFAGEKSIDGESIEEWSEDIKSRVEALTDAQYQLYVGELLPDLKREAGASFIPPNQWTEEDCLYLKEYFSESVAPLLTPIALDVAHPFPHIFNKTLNFIIELEGFDAYGREVERAILPLPKNLPSLLKLPSEKGVYRFATMCELIANFIDHVFEGLTVKAVHQFRVTRNSHLFIDEEELTNLHQTLKGELHQRNFGHAVRLEVGNDLPEELAQLLLDHFELGDIDLYRVKGFVDLTRFVEIRDYLSHKKHLVYPPFSPRVPKKWAKAEDPFKLIRKRDFVLHHPFDSFSPVVELLERASTDPQVQMIRMTVYRTGDESLLMEHLVTAAENGKEVNVVFELMARFDEATNLAWASILEEAGAKVVYGVFGYKTHAKMLLIVRNEPSKKNPSRLRYYTHLSTGNYHSGTAKVYTDLALLTSNKQIAHDVTDIFLSLGSLGLPPALKTLWQAPFTLFDNLMQYIQFEIEEVKAGRKGHIIARMNALLEPKLIEKLYEASQIGVKIDLMVRGACSLKPGIPGLSENIRVISVVGRFLEHSRVYYFYRGGEESVLLASADWMNRNFFRRIEVAVPIQDNRVKNIIINEGLMLYLQDETAWHLDGESGEYFQHEQRKDTPRFSAQEALLNSRE